MTLTLFLVQGCAVGPNFALPPAKYADRYTRHPIPQELPAGGGQPAEHLMVGQTVAAQWWSLFHSPSLNQVVEQALQGNKTLVAARATLAAARENLNAAQGGEFPQLDLNASAQRSKNSRMQSSAVPLLSGPQTGNLYTFGGTVSYAADVFGATRRQMEQQQALTDYQAYELAAAYLTLTGDSVAQALSIASLTAQLSAIKEIVAEDQRNLSLTREKYHFGKAALTDVLIAQTQLDTDLTLSPPLEQQLTTARHALAILTGRSPAQWEPPDFSLQDFILPSTLPLSLPSALVRQRPDILAAEAQLHADSAAIGIATAHLYPSITLSASLGQQSPDSGTLFDAVNRFWNLAAGLTAPLFHGGTLRAQRRAAIETYKASLNNYEQTVLSAFEQVADSLQALQHDRDLVMLQQRLQATALHSLELQQQSYAVGKTDALQLISAQRAYQQARLGFIRTRAQRLQDTATLLLALGGGWWQDLKLNYTPSKMPAQSTRHTP